MPRKKNKKTKAQEIVEFLKLNAPILYSSIKKDIKRERSLLSRHPPRDEVKAQALQIFSNCCVYCGRRIGSLVVYKGVITKLLLEWDHFEPHSFKRNNRPENFFPSCQLCNGVKGAKRFSTVVEAAVYCRETLKDEVQDYEAV